MKVNSASFFSNVSDLCSSSWCISTDLPRFDDATNFHIRDSTCHAISQRCAGGRGPKKKAMPKPGSAWTTYKPTCNVICIYMLLHPQRAVLTTTGDTSKTPTSGGVEVQRGDRHWSPSPPVTSFAALPRRKKDESWLQDAAMKRGGHRPADQPSPWMLWFLICTAAPYVGGIWKKSANKKWCTDQRNWSMIWIVSRSRPWISKLSLCWCLSKSRVFPAMSVLKPSNSFRTEGIGKPAKQ